MNHGMISSMKVAISIPDKTFSALEKVAAERGISRSALYNQALEQMLKELEDQALTESYNRLADQLALEPDILRTQASRILTREDW
jgi:metal-responsive CopG/Arc/MetJ family transcriptional regulator